MVPPLVTASRRAPGRACRVPVSRSHTSRGRNWANSSEGYRPASRSSTASYAERGSERNGALRRRVSYQLSTSTSSAATAETVCWARMSRGLVGTDSGSRCPASICSAITAASRTSPRCLG